MSRILSCVLVMFLVAALTGCQNRCNQPCGPFYAANPRIAPPQTYSLNIPSVAQNPAYYTPNAGNPAVAPAAARTAEGQWRRFDGTSIQPSANPVQPAAAGNGQNRLVETGNPGFTGQSVLTNNANATQTAFNRQPNSPLPASGSSFTDSPNFASTRNDERFDSTRLPVTDATSVRAPAQNLVANGIPQTFVAQNGMVAPSYRSTGTLIARGPVGPYGTPVYSTPAGSPVLVANNTALNPYRANSALVNSSSTGSTGQVNAGQVGWRGREIGSDRLR